MVQKTNSGAMKHDVGAQAFERHALNYAETWGSDATARHMRAEVHRTIRDRLTAGSKVLDLGCGIGLDSAWLREEGHQVLAVERSQEMSKQALLLAPELEIINSPVEEALESLEGQLFDAALLDFGVMNCLDLERVAHGLERCIRPGGAVFVVPMPRIAPAWMLGAIFRGRWRAALERLRRVVPVDVEGLPVATRYLSSRDLVDALGEGFRLESQRSLGLSLVPPGSRSARAPGRMHQSVDRGLSHLPLLRQVGDHLLLVFERQLRSRARPSRVQQLLRRRQTRAAQSSGHIERLRTLILEVTGGCQSQCVGCSHRGPAGGELLSVEKIKHLLTEAEDMGTEEVLITGGEPLLRPDISEILEAVKMSDLDGVLLTNGLALARHAELVSRTCDRVVVSLDACEPELYRRLRGVDGLSTVERGVETLRRLDPNLPITGRCTVTAGNASSLQAIARFAQDLGLADLSFLAADHQTADAFGRQGSVSLEAPDPDLLASELDAVWSDPGPPFISNSRGSLDRIRAKALADRGEMEHVAPRCDAPWTSVVVESDLSLRLCFFLEQQGHVREGLTAGLAEGAARRRALRIEREEACARCVCWAKLGG
jgi:MoaA/NifB/PqqE/SkfB family radical SAM enzyme/SAM-dependent methyltransferase